MATLGRWTGGSATFPTESWASPNGLGTTQARNDSSAYTWTSSSARLTLPSTGLADGYLVIARVHMDCSHNNRHTQQGRFTVNSGTGNLVSSTTGGYSRNNNNDENFITTWAIVDNPSASYSLDYEWKRDTGDGTPNATVSAFSIDVIPLYYADIGMYTSTSTSLLGGTTPNTLPLTTTVLEGTNITRSGNVISVTGDNKRYLIFGSNYTEGRGGRTQRWVGGEYDGTQNRGAMACVYHRDTGTDESGIAFSDIIETVTATRTIEQFVYRGDGVANNEGGANSDGSTPSVGTHAMVVIELNDSAEVIRSSNASASSQAISGTTPVDISAINTVDFNDSASFTKASATAVNAEVAMDALAGANIGAAYNTVSSGVRYEGISHITVNGTEDTNVRHGNYGRGNQSSIDTFGYSANPMGFVALALNDDIGVSAFRNGGDAGPVTAQAAWSGFWAINLDTLEGSATDDLLANDVESASEVTAPSVGQEHALNATDVESASEVTSPAVGQDHQLLADDVESATEVTLPTLAESHVLNATDVESASEVTAPSIGQVHALNAADTESASELTAPALGQDHQLLADDVESASEVTAPAVGQAHALLADDVESTSEVTAPTLTEVIGEDNLLAEDVESASEVTAPAVGQEHALLSTDVESASEVTAPVLAIVHPLLADDVESTSEITVPSLGQVHALTASSVESATETTAPAAAIVHPLLANDVESLSEITAPALTQVHTLLAEDLESTSEVDTPALDPGGGGGKVRRHMRPFMEEFMG